MLRSTRRNHFKLGQIVSGVLMAIITVFVCAVLQANLTVLALTYDPTLVGVTFDSQIVNAKLRSFTQAPAIAGIDKDAKNDFLSIVLSDTFFIKTMPGWMILPFDLKAHPVILVNKTLVITSIDKDAMQTISPVLARLLIHEYFPSRMLKTDPTILVVGRQEYLAFRGDQITGQETEIDAGLQKLQSYIDNMQNDITLSEQKIMDNQIVISSSDTDATAGYQKNISDWTTHLQDDQRLVTQAQTTMQTYQIYLQQVNSQKDRTSGELGLFSEPSTIRIVVDDTSPNAIDEFLETLVHENLHYQSYISGNRRLTSLFFEEGLTEYFARQILSDELGVRVNNGYPLVMNVFTEMLKKIPVQEFERIYFTKGENQLEADVNTAYGNSFYTDIQSYLTALFYESPTQSLLSANTIMARIGGGQLAQRDAFGNY